MLRSILLLSLAPALAPAQEVGDLGQLEFPNSGAPEAQDAFLRGVLLLHSFEYEDARESFQEAQAVDAEFALAYWGEAMTHNHPIWMKDELAEARQVLARMDAAGAGTRTPTERSFVEAVRALYAEGTRPERQDAYHDHMRRMYEQWPEDHEVATFYALSILGTCTEGRDVARYMKAAAVAEEVYAENPKHPGALHYLIHSYDDSQHAPLGLRQARIYAQVAPAAAHALHMPSHIYVALGMWEESVASNIDSSAAADARRERKGLGIEDRGYHSLQWLAYSWLQLGEVGKARAVLRDVEANSKETDSGRVHTHVALIRSAHVVNAEEWSGPVVEMEIDYAKLGDRLKASDLLARGYAAARRGDLDEARARLAEIDELFLPAPTWGEEAEVEGDPICCAPASGRDSGPNAFAVPRASSAILASEIAFAEERFDEALELAREALVHEDSLGLDFGPPIVVKPAHEQLGELLGRMGRADEAIEEFEAALLRAPGRRLSTTGLREARARAAD